VAVPLRCRSWRCPPCARWMKRRLSRILEGVSANRLITLTCNPGHWESVDDAYRLMSVGIAHLVKRIKRKWPNATFEYFMVWEATKHGWPHVHMVARGPYIPQKWLSQQWLDLTGAFIVDIRDVDNARPLASYLAKYLSKELTAPPAMKRYRCSRHFLNGSSLHSLLSPGPASGWKVTTHSLSEVADHWRSQGLVITVLGHDRIEARSPPALPSVPEVSRFKPSVRSPAA